MSQRSGGDFLLLILAAIILFGGEETEKFTLPVETPAVQKEAVVMESVTIDFEIQHGTLYTGAPTPIISMGSVTIADGSLVIGRNGLPIIAWSPGHVPLEFMKEDDETCILRVPGLKSALVALLSCSGVENHTLLRADVEDQGNGRVLVKARFVPIQELKRLEDQPAGVATRSAGFLFHSP